MSGSQTQLVINSLRDDVARLHDHVEKVDGKVDTMAIQIAVSDTHVTRMTREQAETNVKLERIGGKVEKLDNLKFQVIGAFGVISFLLFLAAEAIRIWFH